ncbi:hypothetical protein MFLAVUS_007381 [Mucor flavus]|uniref:Uncharacterized protein n=1 Tax=Mucor flavus TaxID=439312 RepID=A0ABP9Z469_9FUNG
MKDPHGDLVQLVEQCHTESSLFHNLITHSVNEHVSITPHQVLQQEQQLLLQQQQQQQQQRRSYNQLLATQLPKQQLPFNLPLYPNEKIERKRKNTSACTTQSQKRVPKSTSSSSSSSSNNYTHSDSVNAQLLRELIRQAGRSHTQNKSSRSVNTSIIPCSSSDIKTFMPTHGNYQSYRHHPYYKSSSALVSTSRHHLPYHIQTKKISKQQKPVINRPPVSKSNHHPMGRPSMYSSDISQAQLLEIQAISRAQQDFIRAREQQEAEKEMMMKHQQKSKVPNM